MTRVVATSWRRPVLPRSLRVNFTTAAMPVGVVLGGLLGWVVPTVVWRSGTPTPLGDFALVACLGLLVWQQAASSPDRYRIARVVSLGLGLLLLREVLWRLPSADLLSVFYGLHFGALLVLSLGVSVLELVWYHRREIAWVMGEEPLTFDALLRLVLGTLIVCWFLYGLLRA